jgi:hypothetical protein
MSHFSVAVITKDSVGELDLEEILEPYSENRIVTPKIDKTKIELIQEKDKFLNEAINDSNYNPDSKWDWFSIGGGWKNLLCLKTGGKVDSAKIKDVSWEKMNKPSKKDLDYWNRVWEIGVEDKPRIKRNDAIVMWKKEYYLEKYKTKENYIARQSTFSTYAVVTPDVVWHEKGKMGWWGCSIEDQAEAENWDYNFCKMFINEYLKTDYYITIVDCHI